MYAIKSAHVDTPKFGNMFFTAPEHTCKNTTKYINYIENYIRVSSWIQIVAWPPTLRIRGIILQILCIECSYHVNAQCIFRFFRSWEMMLLLSKTPAVKKRCFGRKNYAQDFSMFSSWKDLDLFYGCLWKIPVKQIKERSQIAIKWN